MAFIHGKDAGLLFGGANLSTLFHEAGFSADVDTAEVTTFTAGWKAFIAGQASGSIDLSGYFDPTINTAWGTIGDDPGGVLTAGPGGLGLGAVVRLVDVLTSGYEEQASIGDAVAFSWDITADGAVGFGRIIAASAAITADGNGASFDYTAQSTAGGIAHLHVTSVSAADSIVVTIEDSSTGSSGWATIGTFASKSAAGAERIAIAGTIKRYVRAVYDVTGTDVSIVCTVALARL